MKGIVIALPQPEKQEDKPPLRTRLALFFGKYGMMMFFVAVLISGVVFGAVHTVSDGSNALGKAERIFSSLPLTFEKKQPIAVFADSFSAAFIFTAALCFLALTPAGLPSIPAVVFFRGYEYGVFSCCLCKVYGFKGLAYYISVALSGTFLSAMALVYLSQYCIGCSASMMLAVSGRSPVTPLKERFGELMLHGAYSLIIIVFASLTDTLLYFLIGRLF